MEKSFRAKCFRLSLFLLLMSFSPLSISAISWNGPVNMDVVDTTIDIDGDVTIEGPVHVTAHNQDVTVNVNVAATIQPDTANLGRLYFSANEDQKIKFNINRDWTFIGADDGGTEVDFLVSFTGEGTFEFCIDNNRAVCFSSESNTGGTIVVVGMSNTEDVPLVIFKRTDETSDDNVEVKVGAKSCVTYLADSATTDLGTAKIQFNPKNDVANTGCTILRIEDCGCFAIEGVTLGNGTLEDDFVVADIDFTTKAGAEACFTIGGKDSGGVLPPACPLPPACFPGSDSYCALRVVNENSKLTSLMSNPFCDEDPYDGIRYGFVLGCNGNLVVENCCYLDYIGVHCNVCPKLTSTVCDCYDKPGCSCADPNDHLKERNPSAFWVDGAVDPDALPNAQINMEGNSAIYFRSGIDACGDVDPSGNYCVDPNLKTPGAGNVVFDVEGSLNICGDPDFDNGLSVLSLKVNKTGCRVFVESSTAQPAIFPKRTFEKNVDGEYLGYNTACWLINGCLTVKDASIIHSDECHHVFERGNLGRPDLNSAPTYVGGETWVWCDPDRGRPKIKLLNSVLRIHTNLASNGVDWQVPNVDTAEGNLSQWKFYNNGRVLDDNAYGRVVVLGTGSALDCGAVVDKDSHLDIFQTSDNSNGGSSSLHRLEFVTCPNDCCIVEDLTCPPNIDGQCSVHTVYLNNASNISIGTYGGTMFNTETCPELYINSSFFSFETKGGSACLPCASGTTGEGGIFVDENGKLTIDDYHRANFSAMVVKSGNGTVTLPKKSVYFDNRIGITNWMVDLSDPSQQCLVGADECISDYTMDWGALKKDFDNFTPYEPKVTPSVCDCPFVTEANLTSIPVIKGEVDQFQIKRARLGDMAHFCVDGGKVRETVFLQGYNSAEAPMAFIAIDNNGSVGLGSAHRNLDSLNASIVLGINGVTVCAKGNGVVEVNEDLIINNVCHVVPGPEFGVDGADILTFHSEAEREILVKSGAVLDFSQFNTSDKIVEFRGDLHLTFEPGASLVMGGGKLQFRDSTKLVFEEILNLEILENGNQVSDLDDVRVKIAGTGEILFADGSSCLVTEEAAVSIETLPGCVTETDICLSIIDQAKVQVGNDSEEGGSFQVGNTECRPDDSVSFTLIIEGDGAEFQINRLGFVGLGVGIARKENDAAPNDWLVGALYNVDHVEVDVREGTFRHNQIASGDSEEASLLAVGPSNNYTWRRSIFNDIILGGGNIILATDDALCVRAKRSVDSSPKRCMNISSPQTCDLDMLVSSQLSKYTKNMNVVVEPNTVISCYGGMVQMRYCGGEALELAGDQLSMIRDCLASKMPTRSRKKTTTISCDTISPSKVAKVTRSKSSKRVNLDLQAGGQMIFSDGSIILMNNTENNVMLTPEDVNTLESLFTGKPMTEAMTRTGNAFNPVVLDQNGQITSQYFAGMFAGEELQRDEQYCLDANIVAPAVNVTPAQLFARITNLNDDEYRSGRANVAQSQVRQIKLGYVFEDTIFRVDRERFINGTDASQRDIAQMLEIGAAGITIDASTGDLDDVIQIAGTPLNPCP